VRAWDRRLPDHPQARRHLLTGGLQSDRMRAKRFCLVVVLFALVATVFAAQYSGRVVRIIDGDTIEAVCDGRTDRIRLNGIDCPERRQPFGSRAKKFVSSLVFGQTVTVIVRGRDRYGRTIGDVVLSDGRSLNQELVRAGLAWHYTQYSSDTTLSRLEREARARKEGLWVDARPVAPWDWRHRRRH